VIVLVIGPTSTLAVTILSVTGGTRQPFRHFITHEQPMIIGLDGLLLREKNAGSLRHFQQLLLALRNLELEGDAREDARECTDSFRVFADPGVLAQVLSAEGIKSQQLSWMRAGNLHFRPVRPKSFIPGALQQQCFRSWNSPYRALDAQFEGSQKLDLLHSPLFVPPLTYPGKTVMSIQDLTFFLYPETQKWTGRFWWRTFAHLGFQKADRIIAISESTRNDLVRHFQVDKEKVHVVHLFPLAQFKPVANARQVASHYGLPEKYILFVGTIEPRKNLPFLIKAYHLAQTRSGFEHVLVIVGKRGWMFDEVLKTIEELGIPHRVKFLEYLLDRDLPAIYTAAQLFVFLSKYEGFGIPPLEAMACGTPVIASNTSSIPEVVGQAGILVPPDDLEQAAEAISHTLQNEDFRQHLVGTGFQRAQLFNKDRFRSETLSVYHSLAT
jgi:glycosyltransferase involved in cell wall biosynthesis